MRALTLLFCLLSAQAWGATKWIDVSGVGTGAANGSDVNNQCAGVGDADCIGANLPAGSTAYLCGTLTGAGLTAPVAGSSGNVTTYDGSCPGGTPASITATSGTAAWLANKAYTNNKNMTLAYSGSKPLQINADDVTVEDNVLTLGQDGITLTTPQTRARITVRGNTITGHSRYPITMNYTGASTNSYTDLSILDNHIEGNTNSGIFIQCGVAATTCSITRLTIDGNTIIGSGNTQLVVQDCYDGVDTTGTCADPQSYTLARFTDVTVTDNVVTGSTAGGGISIYGCTSSTSAHGKCVIARNTVTDNIGPIGCVDVFNSRWMTVEDNYCARNTTATIDANGVLVDYGNKNVIVRRNQVYDSVGLAGADNSGVGVMVIRGEDVLVENNIGSGNKTGLFFSGGSFTESNIVARHNTLTNNASYGAYFDNTQEGSSTTLTNNALSGPGTCIYAEASGAANTENYNALGCATRKNYNSVAWSDGANSITPTDLGLVGGGDPESAEGFCLKSTSALLAAGTYIGAWATGYAGHDLGKPPAIGARGLCRDRQPAAERPSAW